MSIKHLKYISKLLISSFTFLLIALLLVRNFLPSGKLFEQVLLTSFLSCIGILILGKINNRSFIPYTEFIAWVLFASVFFSFAASSALLNVDRSRSFYVLGWVDNGSISGSPSRPNLENVRSEERTDLNAIAVRLQEQSQRGIIEYRNGEFSLSLTGNLLIFSSNLLAKLFKLDGWTKNNS